MLLRTLPASLVIAAAFDASAIAQLGPADVAPGSTASRFLPESLPALASPAYFGDLEKAQQLLFHGRYRAALYATYKLPATTPALEVALVRGAACWAMGEDDAALAALAPFAEADPRAGLLLARLDVSRGRYAQAIARLRPLASASTPARYFLGDALERLGDLDGAVAAYRPLAEGEASPLAKFRRDGALGFEQAEDLTLAARGIDRWAAITRAYAKQPELSDALLSMFVGAYDTVDREYWPAHVAAAAYLFDHGNKKQAAEELEAANDANPNAVEVNVLLGQFARANRDERNLAAAVHALRDVDETSFDADLLDASLSLTRRLVEPARALAERCVERQPNNIDALGLLASVHAARGDAEALKQTLARVDAIDPNDARARTEVGVTLQTAFYDAAGAVEQLRVAVARAPWWTEPQHALGNALIQDGEEDEARRVLDRAQAVDPYNVQTVNYLRVLDELAKFKVFESARFTFKYDPRDDPIVPLYLAPQMDAMYDDLAGQFGYVATKRPIVEVFPDAQSFSVRTSGMPGLETYGASLGRVMTVVAPRAGDTLGPFNWARVMRHEFTHTINLTQTHGRVPRWLTEGLAVWEEKVPYRFANVPPQLYALAIKGAIPEPKQMRQGINEMGYMAGFWTVRYVDETLGWPAVLKLLDGYGAGKSDDDAFRGATGMDCAQFDVKFDAWAKEQVKPWGYDDATAKDVEAKTKDAEHLTQAGQYEPAAEAWRAIAQLQPMNPLPPRRLAGIYLRLNRPAEALPFLLQTLPLELQDSRFAKRVARIQDAAGDAASALAYAKSAMSIDPYDADGHALLATLYAKSGDAAHAAQETQVAALLTERKERSTSKP